MSLEDSPEPPRNGLERGDHVVEVPPGVASDIMPDLHVANHYNMPIYYYVQVIDANPISGTRERVIIHFGPISRRDEFAPTPI